MEIVFISLLSLSVVVIYVQNRRYTKQIKKFKDEIQNENSVQVLDTSPVQIEKLEESDEVQSLKNEISRLNILIENTTSIAQDATMIKSDFLTNIRHEIRTPMNAILVFSQMIETETQDTNIRSYSGDIYKSGNILLNLLNSIIEMSEIDSGSFVIETSAVDVKKFIDTVVEVYKHEASKKALEFIVEIDPDIPESIVIDTKRVKEILDNLMANALRFTDKGSIKVLVSLDSFDESKHEANISFLVQDTGMGIAKVNQEKIFRIFESQHLGHKGDHQGTGLGLSINKKLASLMNGNLEVKSELQEGSTFILSLKDVEVVLTSKMSDIDTSNIDFSVLRKNTSIMVIDNSQKTLDMCRSSFAKAQIKLFTYISFKDAISSLQDTTMDLILIDIEILSLDDNAVAKVLKNITKAPIISLVSQSLKGVSFHEAGVKPVLHLKKPLQKMDLFRALLKLLNSQDVLIEDRAIEKIQNNELRFSFDEKASKEYFLHKPKELDTLLQRVLQTKDLSEIKNFAIEVHKLSTEHKVENLMLFSKKLLHKIDTFDVEGIDKMLKEYEVKSRNFKEEKGN